ncbi:MAG: hypothetical protein GF418_17150 [Chitinivibrionales bacterium]|nr:hypothetical protein [Chitinivibrionales bacterium]MBD3397347.1 hypothetical protein [Chitinivibrionales bacterium]
MTLNSARGPTAAVLRNVLAAIVCGTLMQCIFDARGEAVRICCVGDSITRGDSPAGTRPASYPDELQEFLGEAYEVCNLGSPGTCVLKDAYGPYWETDEFARVFELEPKVIVVMFGTNDSKPYNWSSDSAFLRDYQDLVDTLRASAVRAPRIFLCTPPPAFSRAYDVSPDTLHNHIVPNIQQLAASRHVSLVDCYTLLETEPENFPDGIHPDEKGAMLIGAIVHRALEEK